MVAHYYLKISRDGNGITPLNSSLWFYHLLDRCRYERLLSHNSIFEWEMEITIMCLLILIKFYWCSIENIKSKYMCQNVCLLKNVAKFKDAISLIVLKDETNGFNEMLSPCEIPSEEKLNCFWRHSSKIQRIPSMEIWYGTLKRVPERENIINENKSLFLGESLHINVLCYTEKELEWSQQWPMCSWGRRECPFWWTSFNNEHSGNKLFLMYFLLIPSC